MPFVAESGNGPRRCARCGLTPPTHGDSAADPQPAVGRDEIEDRPPWDAVDDWALTAVLRRTEHVLRQPRPSQPAEANLADSMLPAARLPAVEDRPQPAARAAGTTWWAWSMVALGTTALSCGAALLGWSYLQERPELWSLGLTAAVLGQVALFVGMVVQLDRLWGENREAQHQLQAVHAQLGDLSQTARMLGTVHSSASQAFYSHLAEGASPDLLLADLKGQLDLLALRLAQRGR